MDIIQIISNVIRSTSGEENEIEVLGLGNNNKMYVWNWASGTWESYQEKENEMLNPNKDVTRIGKEGHDKS